MNKIRIVSLLFLLTGTSLVSQENRTTQDDVVETIKDDIWTPFMEAYAELDSKKLVSIHSDDILRVNVDRGQIRKGQAYLTDFGGFLDRVKEQGGEIRIAFAILTTAVDEDKHIAYQTGHYQFSSLDQKSGELKTQGHGYFSVGLRKENGVWKIFLDSDQKVNLTPDEFEKKGTIYRLGE